MSSQPASQPNPPKPTQNRDRDFLTHLETYLAKRDGVDKLLKISRYAAKLLLSNPTLAAANPALSARLKSFESSVGLSRKAFRLGKFVQDLNALRNLPPSRTATKSDLSLDFALSLLAYGGEGIYYFVEQFVWLSKSGLIDPKRSRTFQKISAWCEFVGYVGSVALKLRDLRAIAEDEECLRSSVEIAALRGFGCSEEAERLRKVREKKLMKMLSIVQDLADSVMALDDILDGKAPFSTPPLLAAAGLLSALISTHKNWVSC